MTLILKQLFGLLKLINSDTGHIQISMGLTAGFILGMTPAFSIQTILIWLTVIFFRIQIGAALISAFFFSFIAYLLDPIFHWVGSMVLESSALFGLLTSLYNLPLVPLTRFNNSVVMGVWNSCLFY